MADNYVAISIKALDEGAKPDLTGLQLKLDALKDRVATARADVTTAEADAKLTDLEAKLEYVSKKIASPRIDIAGAARANAQITGVEAQLDGLDAKAAESAAVQESAAAKSAKSTAGAAAGMAGWGEKAKLALLGVGVGAALAVKGAADFQSQTTRLVTSAGELPGNLAMVQRGMLSISAATATSTGEMAKGMYTVESAGFHGAQGLTVLKSAAQGAKDEGADLATVANAVTDVLVDFHMKASQSATATSMLVKAVSFGKTTFEEFSGSMANILPLAASMHLKLADVTGVLAEMTAHGMSAQRASEDEANAMRSLLAPTGAMAKEFGLLGITSEQVHAKLGSAGLGGTMQWLSGIARRGATGIGQNYTEAMKKLMGTAPGLVTALMTTGKNARETNKAIAGIGGASADASGNVEGFSKVSQTMNFKMEAAGNAVKAAGISLGSALLPAVTAVMGPIASFGQFLAGNAAAADTFAIVIGGVLAGALGSKLAGALRDVKAGVEGFGKGIEWVIGKIVAQTAATEAQTAATEAGTVAQGELDAAMDANPIGLIIIAIVALVAVVVLLATHWKTVWHAITAATDAAGRFIRRAFHDIAHWAAVALDWIRSHWPLLLAILAGPIGLAAYAIASHWHQITAGAARMFHDVVSFFSSLPGRILSALGNLGGLLWNAGISIIEGLYNGLVAKFNDVKNFVSGVATWIADHKGPIGADAVLLRPHGRAIMGGLVGGLKDGMPGLAGQLERTTAAISGGVRGAGGGQGQGGQRHLIIELRASDSRILAGLQATVREAGGDPQMFVRKVAFR